MTGKTYNVLFLCTGNSARSILAEALIGRLGEGRLPGGSAPEATRRAPFIHSRWRSSNPSNTRRKDSGARGGEEFARPGAPEMDFVFTVCDDAAGEVCPVWPGSPVTAHWGVPGSGGSGRGRNYEEARFRLGVPHAREAVRPFRIPAGRGTRPPFPEAEGRRDRGDGPVLKGWESRSGRGGSAAPLYEAPLGGALLLFDDPRHGKVVDATDAGVPRPGKRSAGPAGSACAGSLLPGR